MQSLRRRDFRCGLGVVENSIANHAEVFWGRFLSSGWDSTASDVSGWEGGGVVIVLESERLLFRSHVAADVDAFCAMEDDAEVRRYVGGSPRTREAAEQRFRERAMQPVEDRLAMWATVLKADGRYIGRCGLYPKFREEGRVAGEAVLGFYLAREFWGQGFASEAGRAFVEFGFDELKLERIVTAVQVENAASIRVLEKLGFVIASHEKVGPRSFYHFELSKPVGRAVGN
jgi:[ribosomal protein S5]-alanine N-acetyltransferase